MKRLALLLVLLAALLASCERENKRYPRYDNLVDLSRPLAMGKENEVFLFLGIPSLSDVVPVLEASVTRTIRLLEEEQYFRFTALSAGKLDAHLKYRNLILCGSLDSPDAVSAYIRKSLSPAETELVNRDGAQLYEVSNKNSSDQYIIYLVGKNTGALRELATAQAEGIFAKLLARYKQRLAWQAYKDNVMPASTFSDWPFTIQIPWYYEQDVSDLKNKYLSFYFKPQNKPTKIIAVHAVPMESNSIDPEWLLAMKQEMGKRFLDGDQVVTDNYQTEETKIAGREGWKLSGQWENPGLYGGIGGAFQCFAFWDAKSKTTYLIDNIVYYPSGDKLEPLLQLEMISESLALK